MYFLIRNKSVFSDNTKTRISRPSCRTAQICFQRELLCSRNFIVRIQHIYIIIQKNRIFFPFCNCRIDQIHIHLHRQYAKLLPISTNDLFCDLYALLLSFSVFTITPDQSTFSITYIAIPRLLCDRWPQISKRPIIT